MDLIEASRQGIPLQLALRNLTPFPVAEVFARRGGIVYADTGWGGSVDGGLPGGHVFHVINGRVTEEDGAWRIGEARFTPIDLDTTSRQADDWREWQAFQQTEEGKTGHLRQHCRNVLKRLGYKPVGD